jgi:hypothetical protein
MQIELLIKATEPDRGKVSAWQSSPASWGAKEGPPTFAIVETDLPDDATPAGCRWDFDAGRLVGELQPQPAASEDRHRPGPPPRRSAGIDVVVTCHAPYLDWLRGCLRSIDAQVSAVPEAIAGQRILVLDGCRQERWMMEFAAWQIIEGEWGDVSRARNAAFAEFRSPWVVYFDADNEMLPGYLAACAERVAVAETVHGVFFPAILRCDADLRPIGVLDLPAREIVTGNYVDTASCWRVDAIEAAGGWPETDAYEDWAMALALVREGWTARPLDGPPILQRQHGDNLRDRRREAVAGRLEQLAPQRIVSIVTPLAPGRERQQLAWLDWLHRAELLPLTGLVLVDNGAPREIVDAAIRTREWQHVVVLPDGRQLPNESWRAVHQHVAGLYRRAFAAAPGELVLTLEDDVLPPADALPRLYEAFIPGRRVGCCAAVYPVRDQPDRACATAGGLKVWGEMPYLDDLLPVQQPIGKVGGGCTLWAMPAIRDASPITVSDVLGWDGELCYRLELAGWQRLLDGRVLCTHDTD